MYTGFARYRPEDAFVLKHFGGGVVCVYKSEGFSVRNSDSAEASLDAEVFSAMDNTVGRILAMAKAHDETGESSDRLTR